MKSLINISVAALLAATAFSCQKQTTPQAVASQPLSVEQTVSDTLWQLGTTSEFSLNDSVQAYKYYKQSADAGNAIGYYMFGHALQHGIGVEENTELSKETYRKSVAMLNELLIQREDKILLNFLGSAYYWGDGVEQDRVKAAECYLRSAELGNPETQYKIATMYETGDGVEQDLDKAMLWYQQAAEQGWQAAIDRLNDK